MAKAVQEFAALGALFGGIYAWTVLGSALAL